MTTTTSTTTSIEIKTRAAGVARRHAEVARIQSLFAEHARLTKITSRCDLIQSIKVLCGNPTSTDLYRLAGRCMGRQLTIEATLADLGVLDLLPR